MEKTCKDIYENTFSELNALRKYKDATIRLNVNYLFHECTGNLDDGEDSYYKEHNEIFNYPIMNILMVHSPDYPRGNSMFILSSHEGSNVLLPFKYEVIPTWSVASHCIYLTNKIEHIIAGSDLNISLSYEFLQIAHFDDGIKEFYSREHSYDNKSSPDHGLTLEKYGCIYDGDKHIIIGDIGRLANTLFPMWK